MTVTPLAFDHLVEIVSVLADAFHDYPVMRYVLGPDARDSGAPYPVRLHRLVQLFASGRAYRQDPMLGLRDDGGALIGAAVMTQPKPSPPPPAFVALRESIWAELGAAPRSRYDTYAAAADLFAAVGPHHHLNMIGVRRAYQGLGKGGELLAAVHDLATADPDSAGVSLTTERSQNVVLYERFGYRVVGHVRVAHGFETWGMFRDNPAGHHDGARPEER